MTTHGQGGSSSTSCADECASEQPVEYGTGRLLLAPVHLRHGAYNLDWLVRPFYSNLYPDDPGSGEPDYVGLLGHGWATDLMGHIIRIENGAKLLYYSLKGTIAFQRVGVSNQYLPLPRKPGYSIVHESVAAEYQMGLPNGQIDLFHDHTVTPAELRGQKKGVMDAGRHRWVATRDLPNQTLTMSACEWIGSLVCKTSMGTPAFKFATQLIGDKQRIITGDFYIWTEGAQNPKQFIARVVYEYYTADETDKGLLGDLKRATIERCTGNCFSDTPTWATWLVTYYRYYTSSSSIGMPHGLKYVLEPEGYHRMSDPQLGNLNPLTATDAQLAPYADYYFEYDSSKRVTKERRHGTGTGSLTSTFSYTARVGGSDGFNEWKLKTVETRPDGTTVTVYTNYLTQVILRDFQSGTQRWYDYNEYDTLGRLIRKALPSAVASYTQGSTSPQNLSVTLNASDGLIYDQEYYGDEPTVTAPGHLKTVRIKQGSGGSLVKLRAYEYEVWDDGTLIYLPRYLVKKETLYLSATDDTKTAVTNYEHDFHSNSTQVSRKTTTLPAVPADVGNPPVGEHGSGTSPTRIEDFDTYGYPTQVQDERGIKTRYTWNQELGVATQRINNYISDQSGPGINVTTDYTLNARGTITRVLGPLHQIDRNGSAINVRTVKWIVYDEANFERREGFGYQTANESLVQLVNPVTIYKFDRANRVKDVIRAKKGTTLEASGALTASDSFAQSTWVRWTNLSFDNQGKLSYQRLYHSIPSSGAGSPGTHYNQTDYGYSAVRLPNRVKAPGGTIHRVVYNTRKLETEYWVGTDDIGATDSNPAGTSSSTSNNMVVVRKQEYDGNTDKKNGNLTKTTLYENASTTRVTTYLYDWRDRRTDLDGEVDLYEKYQYDNLDRLTLTERRNTSIGGALVWKREVKYDKRGRIYQRILYPATGNEKLFEDLWYDQAENVIKRRQPGSAGFEKFLYDALGRLIKRYTAYGTDGDYTAVQDVSGNTVMRQEEFGYDDAGNRTRKLVRDRYHNESATNLGELGTPTDSLRKARVTCVGYWPDGLGRPQAEADYGTNGIPNPWSWTRPDLIPATSGSVLVSRHAHEITGELESVTVPSGTSGTQVTRREYDQAGRLIRLIENYLSGQSGPDKNKTTEFEYTADGNLKKLRAKSTTPGDQVTEWIYGTTLTDSDVASNALVRQKIYPDSTGASDRVYLKWNRQSEPREFLDQATTVHTLQYDKLGRLEHDRVTTLASGVDGAVRRLTAAYGVHGLTKLSSWNNPTVNSGSVVNEVELVYNEFGQITQDRQAHAGAADAASLRIAYEYENGSANHVRLKKIVYPTTTRFLEPLYGTGDQNDALSRVKQLRFTQSGAVVVADYSYLGLDRPVVVDYPEPDVKLNLASGSGNYPYAGLDQFDRLLQALWQYYGSPNADREKVVYGYDLAGNRLTRDNQLSGSGGQDEKYAYDGLWQVSTLDRGTWDGSTINPKVFAQAWTFDQTGNWANFKQDDNGDGTWELNQNRTHNLANEIATIQVWGAVVHDPVGNMTRIPKPAVPANRYACIWDAWNRLVEVKETDGSGNPTTTVAAYAYDGFYRRTKKVIGASTRDYYYSLGWQVLEERVGGALDRQFVWGIRHIDDLVLRDRGAERLYAVHDAMHVTAVTNASGAVQERYGYDAFGKPRFMDASFGARSASSFDWETLFDGYRFDAETGLYQVRFRYLHPGLGRWLSRDPIGHLAGTNLMSYVRNKPIWSHDPFGLQDSKKDPCPGYYAALDALLELIDECNTGGLRHLRSVMDELNRQHEALYEQCRDAGCLDCDRDNGGNERPPVPVPAPAPSGEKAPWERPDDWWKSKSKLTQPYFTPSGSYGNAPSMTLPGWQPDPGLFAAFGIVIIGGVAFVYFWLHPLNPLPP